MNYKDYERLAEIRQQWWGFEIIKPESVPFILELTESLQAALAAAQAECRELHEKVAALESREVCYCAHENVETCGYCQRDRLRVALGAWEAVDRGNLAGCNATDLLAALDIARQLTAEALGK